MKRDQESVCKLLRETVGVLCRSGLQFSVGLRVQGLLAVTVDNNDVFIVQFDDLMQSEQISSETPKQQQDSNIRQTCPHLPGSTRQFYNSSDSHPATIGRRQSQRRQFSQQQTTTIARCSHAADVITINDEADENATAFDLKCKQSIDHLTRDSQSDTSHSDANCGDDRNYSVTALADNKMFVASGSADETEMLESGTINEPDPDYNLASNEWNNALPTDSPNNYSDLPVSNDIDSSALKLHVKQEHRTQPAARQIVTKYRQQKQAAAASASNGQSFMESSWSRQLHECTYPDCGKYFRHRQDLLRHQTQKHGRAKSRVMVDRTLRYFIRPGAADSQN